MTQLAPPARTFLFLQGLASDFFELLGAGLAARGHGVCRINLNAGDWVFWRRPNGVNYRGRMANWPGFVADQIQQRGVTDLILFGDCRPMHQAAIQVAQELRVAIHVVEEGYLRPNWVTIELGGVNGHSNLPRDSNWFREAAAALPPVPPVAPIPSTFRRRATADLAYNISAMLLCWLYPFYRTHRPWHPAVEYVGWARRLLGQRWAERRAAEAVQKLEGQAAYYFFPLQLDCDSQVRLHSRFAGMREAIATVLESFAANAPPGTLLAVKEHPMDNGLVNWRHHVTGVAKRFGMLDRLVYLEAGNTDWLVQNARGVVTVNSTTGTLALGFGVPVITLGTAIYDLPGLTFQDGLEAFWSEASSPDAALFDAFRRVLVHRCLIRGGFFSDEGLAMLVDGAVARLEAAEPPRALRNQAAATGSVGYALGSREAPALLRP